jgi:AraC-like DNA-binding protein
MNFTHNPNFSHPFFKDIIRIDYADGAAEQLINDFGYSYLMFRVGDFLASDFNRKNVSIPKVFLKPTGNYFYVTAPKNGVWISLEMPTTCFHRITKLQTSEASNKLHDLSQFLPKELVERLFEQVIGETTIEEIAKQLDANLSEHYNLWSEPLESDSIVNKIYKANGLLNLADLLKEYSHSQRTLERLFKKEVGVSPQRFLRLVRFNFIIREIETQQQAIPDLIEKYNYYDRSHFEKDFQKFLGQSLKGYQNAFNPLLTQALGRVYTK